MARPKQPQHLAKFLEYVLGRRPDEFGLVPDGEGFVRIKELLQALHEEEGYRHIRRSHLNELLLTLNDAPVQIDGSRIRACVRGALPQAVAAAELPKLLYTCVRQKAYRHVQAKGLAPTRHARVILAAEESLALRIGRRSDHRPVLLTVQVQPAEQTGVVFKSYGKALFLADAIPVGCFTGPPLPKEKVEPRKPAREITPQPPLAAGSYFIDLEDEPENHKQPRRSKKHREKAWKYDRKRQRREKYKER